MIFAFTVQSQDFEVAVGAGPGNYSNGIQPNNEVFEAPSFSPMLSVMFVRPWLRGGTKTISIEAGAGITYTHYKGQWNEEMRYYALTTTGSMEYEEFHRFDGNIHTLGVEVTPLIATFWNRLELRSGIYFGFNLHDKYRYQKLVNRIIWDNGTVLFEDGSYEDYPVESPDFVLHSNSRISYNFAFLNSYMLAPFYQYSFALLNEGESTYFENIRSYRHHFGLTLRYIVD